MHDRRRSSSGGRSTPNSTPSWHNLGMTSHPDAIPILITPGHIGDNGFILRFPPEYSDEILALLDEQGIDHNTALEMSADQILWLEIVEDVITKSGGVAALAYVIKTIVNRHSAKRFVLKKGDFEVEASGYSDRKVHEFLQAAVEEQARIDAKTREVLGLPSSASED